MKLKFINLIAAIKSQNAPKFSERGSFKVAGVGGVDSNLIRMRVSPGEMVDVRKHQPK